MSRIIKIIPPFMQEILDSVESSPEDMARTISKFCEFIDKTKRIPLSDIPVRCYQTRDECINDYNIYVNNPHHQNYCLIADISQYQETYLSHHKQYFVGDALNAASIVYYRYQLGLSEKEAKHQADFLLFDLRRKLTEKYGLNNSLENIFYQSHTRANWSFARTMDILKEVFPQINRKCISFTWTARLEFRKVTKVSYCLTNIAETQLVSKGVSLDTDNECLNKHVLEARLHISERLNSLNLYDMAVKNKTIHDISEIAHKDTEFTNIALVQSLIDHELRNNMIPIGQ